MSDDFELLMKSRPHVVLLGAGASCAAIPDGDKNGRKISAMSGFIDKLGLKPLLSSVEIHTDSDNLEDIYMELDERASTEPDCKIVVDSLDKEIRSYMSGFEIPEQPTVYDFLILSLSSKDLIATFNWDPLLVQALNRCREITHNIPQVIFLHGNVAVGYCSEDNISGNIGGRCPRCKKAFEPMPLLYPVKNKNYNSSKAIAKSWETLRRYMKKAYLFTIFGYSAPKSDVAAVEMMKQAWGSVDSRNLEEIEIIDLRDEDVLVPSWGKFIHTHHYGCHKDIFDSRLGRFPRRTTDVLFDQTMNVLWPDGGNGLKRDMGWKEIKDYMQPLLIDEMQKGSSEILTDPYV